MNRAFVSKHMLLAGVSALAILVAAGAAHSASWDLPGTYTFTATTSGTYAVEVIGATGGSRLSGAVTHGGAGAEVTGDLMLTAGASVEVFVAGAGESSTFAGGGGGLSAIASGSGAAAFLVVAGGGGGASVNYNGSPGQIVADGSPGGGTFGGAGGVAGGGYTVKARPGGVRPGADLVQ